MEVSLGKEGRRGEEVIVKMHGLHRLADLMVCTQSKRERRSS